MVTIKELVKKADPEGEYKKRIKKWDERLMETPPSLSPINEIYYEYTDRYITDLEHLASGKAHELALTDQISINEYKRLSQKIPSAFADIRGGCREDYYKKYKVML
jgi:hypothetical protein